MSKQLLEYVKRFLQGEIPVDEFVESYDAKWKAERDSKELLADDPITSEKLSTFFCFADLYNPNDDRFEYEFDEKRLRAEMQKVFDGELGD
ncbi:Bacterial self-protective colicin-like immunity [Symmachiella macrocystis]|uniref:Bacterial self-protective colicin-like immunity n=1 Tax=Symmachiella macrocystis TaxID=2527985 RepID=A0A5C6B9M9_9PLAN|nr:colicin immunity domain-containing protein [Symmachiella macrocystis]TWU08668.1 Bacterial self-protective colicin-like immunity [Symmachiella macrocystis]